MKSKTTTARRKKITAKRKSSRPAIKATSGQNVLEGIRRSQERQRHAGSDSQTSAFGFSKIRGDRNRTTQSSIEQKKRTSKKRLAKISKYKTPYEIAQIESSKKTITHGKRRTNIAALKSEPHTISKTMRNKEARELAARRDHSKRKMPPPIRNIRGHDSQKQNSRTSLQNETSR